MQATEAKTYHEEGVRAHVDVDRVMQTLRNCKADQDLWLLEKDGWLGRLSSC